MPLAPIQLLACAALLFVFAAPADAQRRSAKATSTPKPPVIDGVLTDGVWSSAEPLSDFYQIVPVVGEPSERTEVRVLFDRTHIYFGFRFFDSSPAELISTSRERDASLEVDDRIEFVIDTFRDRRNAYFFQINPAGSKGDALVTDNGSDFNKPWDGIWEGKTSVDAEGWSAEIAIPFKTLSFDEGLDTWGFNAMRYIGRRNEKNRWATSDRDTHIFTIAQAGDLTGLEGMQQGTGLDVIPFYTSNWSRDRTGGEDSDLVGEPGVDAFYKITPNLTLSMTVNTDFAETEVDERQINLTRFPLFFPERRDFFLQDAGVFAFAGGQALPFFSRTIGLANGDVVPLAGGVKLTGRAGDYNIGVLDVITRDSGTQDGENLFVARVSRNIGEQSSVGAIVTHGNPRAQVDNAVYGIDAAYRSNTFGGNRNIEGKVWALVSDTEGVSSDDAAFGASLRSPNDRWTWSTQFREIQENFNPALGFVSRKDIRQYDAGVTFTPRVDEHVRQLEFSVDASVTTDTDDVLETWWTEVQPLGIQWDSGDVVRVEYNHTHDELRQDFQIAKGVAIPGGAYDYDTLRVEFESSENRPLFTEITLANGSFFDGDRTSYNASVGYRISPFFTSSIEYGQNDIDLEGGSFSTQLSRLRTLLSFSADLSWNTFVQWDNVSETVGINSRIRWLPTPGQEVFLVFNETLDENRDSVIPLYQQVAFKIAYTIRF